TGLKTFLRNLGKLDPEYNKAAKEIHGKVAEPVVKTSKVIAPKLSGAMANTIKAAPTTRLVRVEAGRGLKPTTWKGSKFTYAGVIHFGPNPRPFIEQARTMHLRDGSIIEIWGKEF